MNKKELVEAIAKGNDMSKVAAEGVLNTVIETITKSLKKGEDVQLVGFGTFTTSKRAARTARNPQTGAAIKVPAARVARFRVGAGLKAAVAKK